MDFYTIEPCVTLNAFEIKFKNAVKIDMKKAAKALKESGEILATTPIVIVLKSNSFNASVYASGKILMKNVDMSQAQELGKKITTVLEKGGAFIQ